MVNFYIHKINSGDMTLAEVPSLWNKKVEDKLKTAE